MGTTTTGRTAEAAAFHSDDLDLAGHAAFDPEALSWLEERDAVPSLPSDPFHRVDIRHSSRHIRVSSHGTVLVESTSPVMAFETSMVFETSMADQIYLRLCCGHTPCPLRMRLATVEP